MLLDLPMEPLDYPASDPGPHTLLAGNSREENLKRLDWVLARASGYIAVAGGGGRFAASERAPPVLNVLARRGLALVEIDASASSPAAAAVGLPYASAPTRSTRIPRRWRSISRWPASNRGPAITAAPLGVAQDYPVSLERLRLWAATLADKGLVLAPVSAVLIEQSGLSSRYQRMPAQRRPAEGQPGRPASRAIGPASG